MRCPKCGFISFDDQASCAKCAHDLAATIEQLHGTSIREEAPFFIASLLDKAAALEEEGAGVIFETPEVAEPGEIGEPEGEREGAGLDISEEGAEPEEVVAAETGEPKELEVSDLVPPQEESAPVSEFEEEEAPMAKSADEESSREIPDESVIMEETSTERVDLFETDLAKEGDAETAIGFEPGESEDEGDIVDLSSLMDESDIETSEQEEGEGSEDLTIEKESTYSGLDLESPAEEDESSDLVLESEDSEEDIQADEVLSDAEEQLDLTLEDEEIPLPDKPAASDDPSFSDIPDLGLSLENEDDE